MSSLLISIDGNSIMEQNIRAIGVAYDALTLSSKVVTSNDQRPTWAFGRAALNYNSGPPSVTWVPSSGPISPPLNVGGGLADGGTTVKARSLADRMLSFDVYCNGATYEQTENLLVSVIAATRAALQVGTVFGDETWLTEQADSADTALNEVVAILDVSIRMPVLDESGALVALTTQQHTEILDPNL